MPRNRRNRGRGKARGDQGTPEAPIEKTQRQPKSRARRASSSPGTPLLKVGLFTVVALALLIPGAALFASRQNSAPSDSSSPTPATTAQATPSATPTRRPTLTPTPTPTVKPTATPTTTPTPEPTATPIPPGGTPLPGFTFGGRGPQVTSKMDLNAGLAVFTLKHTGSAAFVVGLLDSQGERVDLLANASGAFDGSRPVAIPKEGQYVLDVQADGNWTALVEQPRSASATLPLSLQGQGPASSKLFSLKSGTVSFTMMETSAANNNNSSFNVWLVDLSGRRIESLANAMGNFNGSKTVNISRSGVYGLGIEADGNWTVSVSQ